MTNQTTTTYRGKRLVGLLVMLIIIGAVVGSLMALVVLVIFPHQEDLAQARQTLEQISGWLMVIRLTVIGFAWWYWDLFFDWYFRDPGSETLAYIKTRRHVYTGLFLAIEFILIQNVLATAWAWIQ